MLKVAVRRAQHTTGSCSLVTNGNELMVIKNIVTAFGNKQRYAQLNNITTGVKLTGIYVLEESADKILEDITHLNAVKAFNGQIQFGKGFNRVEQATAFIHLLDMGFHIEVIQDILNVIGKALNVRLKVFRNVVGIVAQLLQRKLAYIIELITGNSVHALRRVIRVLVVFCYNISLSLCQSALKTANNSHRDNNITILIRHIRTTQLIGNTPDKIRLCAYIDGIIIPKHIYFLDISHDKTSNIEF